jgi:hypothetical protein
MKAIVRSQYGGPDVLEMRDALRYLEGGHAKGKVVITVGAAPTS